MGRRSIAQLALLVVGFVLWGYGSRVGDPRLTWGGIVCFALATLLRFFKKRESSPEEP